MSGDHTAIPIEWDPQKQRMQGIAYHGNTYFDVPYLSHISHNLYTGGCTTGLILPRKIKHLISLYPWERYTINHEMDSELYFRMYDEAGEVNADQVRDIARWAARCLDDGPTLIHCQAGLNRSSLIAAATLIYRGMEPNDAIRLIQEKRSDACLCNVDFQRFLYALRP